MWKNLRQIISSTPPLRPFPSHFFNTSPVMIFFMHLSYDIPCNWVRFKGWEEWLVVVQTDSHIDWGGGQRMREPGSNLTFSNSLLYWPIIQNVLSNNFALSSYTNLIGCFKCVKMLINSMRGELKNIYS